MNRLILFCLFCLFNQFVLLYAEHNRLTIQTQYIRPENLASHFVGTPKKKGPTKFGQRLLIQWTLPRQECQHHRMLHLTVRYKDYREKKIKVPIRRAKGLYLYEIINEEFIQSGGIMTYKAEITDGEKIITDWIHPLWVPLIQLTPLLK